MTTFAREHETVTCQNGHPVLEVVNDLVRRTQVRAVDFRSAQDGVADPVQHVPFGFCAVCGQRYSRPDYSRGITAAIQFHFEDGWRPSQ